MYIRHWGLTGNSWHTPYQAGWIEVNPSLYNALDGQNVTNRPLTAHQGYVLNNKINNKGKNLKTGTKTRTLNVKNSTNVGKYFYIPEASLTLETGTWLVFVSFKNESTTSIIGHISTCTETPDDTAPIDGEKVTNLANTTISAK